MLQQRGHIGEQRSQRELTVEMDPVSEVCARERLNQVGRRIVGWYHSHPVFAPDPSVRDLENQQNLQGLHRDDAAGTDRIDVTIEARTGKTTVRNTGRGIAVRRHETASKRVGEIVVDLH